MGRRAERASQKGAPTIGSFRLWNCGTEFSPARCITTVPCRSGTTDQKPEEEWAADHRGHDPDRQLDRRHDGPGYEVAAHQERRAEQCRRGKYDAVVRADEQPHQVRYDDADEADRTTERHGRPRGQRGTEERETLRPQHVDAA